MHDVWPAQRVTDAKSPAATSLSSELEPLTCAISGCARDSIALDSTTSMHAGRQAMCNGPRLGRHSHFKLKSNMRHVDMELRGGHLQGVHFDSLCLHCSPVHVSALHTAFESIDSGGS